MPRYFFHLVSEGHTVQDTDGVNLNELSAAHEYAVKLQYHIRQYSHEPTFEWMVRVSDGNGATPLVVLPPRQIAGPLPLLWRFASKKPGPALC
jgi:hypothetical protein